MAIPVIDFSKLKGEERAQTLAQIAIACEDWGFFQVMNHGIPEELLERVKKVSSECYKVEREPNFKNSEPVKLLNDLVQRKSEDQIRLDNVDWEDVFTLMDDDAHTIWPSKTPGFKETMMEYRSELKRLAVQVMELMDENLGLSKGYIKATFNGASDDNNKAFFGTKVSHYPPCPHPEKVDGLRAHTDAGGVILLFQDDQFGGLQVLKDGEWIEVQPLLNAIVINTGDQIEVLSNGKYKSAWHRVLASHDGNRRSIASFYNPSTKAVIAPAEEFVGKMGEEKEMKGLECNYPKFVFGDYMSVYAKMKFQAKEPRFEAVGAM